ncbi:MAG: hypothetical protein Q8R17_00555 [bacterium]|nr:hypothetical protein [bacterium]
MNTLTISKNELKNAVRESVREAFGEEMMALRASLIPFVSDNEQADIERRYHSPSQKVVKSVTLSL